MQQGDAGQSVRAISRDTLAMTIALLGFPRLPRDSPSYIIQLRRPAIFHYPAFTLVRVDAMIRIPFGLPTFEDQH